MRAAAPPGPMSTDDGWGDDEQMQDDRDPVVGHRGEGPSVELVDFPPEDEEEASDTGTIILEEDDSVLMDQSSLQERFDHAGQLTISEVVSLNFSSPGDNVITIDE